MAQYQLYYHAGNFAGRGEPIRMLLDIAGVQWEDTCRIKSLIGPPVIQALRDSPEGKGQLLMFPPALVDNTGTSPVVVSQLPNIMNYIAENHGLAGRSPAERARALQITLTYCDLVAEAMAAYHPVSGALSVEQQWDVAEPLVRKFLDTRVDRYLAFFEEALQLNGGGSGFVVGDSLTQADVSLLMAMRGYRGSAPEHCASNDRIPLVKAHEGRMRAEPRVRAFLQSDRTVDHFYNSFS